MSTDAGKRRETVGFERETATRGSLGVKGPGTWASLGTRFASVRFGTSAERREAAAEQAVQACTFRTLRDELTATITVRDRIAWDGLVWDITGIALVRPPVGAAEMEFTATASKG